MALYHVYSQTVADGTATSVVRPSDWNSAHVQSMALYGNTAGQSTVSGTNIVFQGGNNISLSVATGTGPATIVFSGANQSAQPINYSAANGSTSANTLVFANSNGVSFSTGTQGVYATVATNYQSQGAYLTTAMQSNASSAFAGTGFTSTTTAGSVIVATHNTAGLSMGVPAYLTTSPAQTVQPMYFSASGTSTSSGTIQFGNTNGVSFSLSNGSIVGTVATNYQSQGAYLTTAMQSNASSAFAGTGFTSSTVTGTVIQATHNTAGLSMLVPAYITTFSGGAGSTTYNGVGIADSAGTQTSGTVVFSNSNGVSFGLNAGTMTASYNSTQFNLVANTTKYAGTNTTFAGTNISGSITMNTAGLNLALSAAAPGGAVTINDFTPYQLAASSTTSFAQNTLHFAHVLPQAYVAVSAIEMLWSFSHSSTSNVAWTNARTLTYGMFAENTVGGGTAFSLLASSSFAIVISASSNLSMGLTMSQGTNSQTYSTAASAISAFNQNQYKIMSLPFATTLNPSVNPYYFGYVMSTATTGANVGVTHQYIMNNEQSNASNGAWAVTGFTASNKSIVQEPYGFIYSATSGGLGASYAYSDMSINSNTQPYLYFEG